MLEKGDKVCYIPYKDAPQHKWQNGIVKYRQVSLSHVFVVYNCANDWENFENYTAARTDVSSIIEGWKKVDDLND